MKRVTHQSHLTEVTVTVVLFGIRSDGVLCRID